MTQARCSRAEFVHLYETIGPVETAKRLKNTERRVHERRASLEKLMGRAILPPDGTMARGGRRLLRDAAPPPPGRLDVEIENGVILVGSDAHYWPGEASTAHRAFVKLCKEMKPKAVVMNGDAFDGATISRHPPIGWEKRPSVILELEACQERLGEIEQAAGKVRKLWPLGNHDARFETRLAMQAPEYAKVNGVHLRDHFPLWEPCWSVFVNEDLVVKHRFKNGIHAPHNNTLWAGRSMITGHLHSAKVQPITDYSGTRYGVDSGTMAVPTGPQFVDYCEDNPVNWRSAVVVVTYWRGVLLQPELVLVLDEVKGLIQFRGEVIRV